MIRAERPALWLSEGGFGRPLLWPVPASTPFHALLESANSSHPSLMTTESYSGGSRYPDPIDAAHYMAIPKRIEALLGSTEGSPEEEELARLATVAEAFEEAAGWAP